MAEETKTTAPLTVRFPTELAERIRDAAFWSRESLVEILEAGALLRLKELEQTHNKGKPFPRRTKELAKRPKKVGSDLE